MNYIKHLEQSNSALRNKILIKEKRVCNKLNSILPRGLNDPIGSITNKINMITVFANGLRMGMKVLKLFF